MRPTVSFLIVTLNSREELERTLPAVVAELTDGDELIVVDNQSTDETAAVIATLAPAAHLILNDRNTGFAAACNKAAYHASGDLLVFLNPDATPLAGLGEAIRRPWVEERGWAAWQALVAEADGTQINSAGNPVHFTGFVWAGSHGQPIGEAPGPGQVPALSGACLAIPRQTWIRAGGFPGHFFLYHEDVDLSLRLRLAGGELGIEPTATVNHDYEFGANEHKWRWLERNRWAFLIRVYPASLLILVLPALLATELALIAISIRGGWATQKLLSILDVVRWLPRLLRERRQIQAKSTVGAAEFSTWLTPDLSSPFFPGLARRASVRLGLRAYWSVVRKLLGGSGGRDR